MKLKEYIKNLIDFAETNSKHLELDVVTSKDDEGNGYNLVYYKPSKGIFDDGDFQTENKEYRIEEDDYNAVCVN
jgi:hypothetical protein